MIWFSADTVSIQMCLQHLLGEVRSENLIGAETGDLSAIPSAQVSFLDAIQSMVVSDDPKASSLVQDALDFALSSEGHIMDITREGLLKSLRSLIVKGIGLAIEYDENHPGQFHSSPSSCIRLYRLANFKRTSDRLSHVWAAHGQFCQALVTTVPAMVIFGKRLLASTG